MGEKTFHSYVAFCSKRIYGKYGHILENILLRKIYTMGLEYPEGVQGNDRVYHHGVLVMSPVDITPELPVLFPEIPADRWHHDEQELGADQGPIEAPKHTFSIRI